MLVGKKCLELRGRLELIEGIAAQQFGQLYGYIEEMRNTNPSTTVIMKVKPVIGSETDVKFKRLYICWGGLKKGFMEGCRPVIGLDGYHCYICSLNPNHHCNFFSPN